METMFCNQIVKELQKLPNANRPMNNDIFKKIMRKKKNHNSIYNNALSIKDFTRESIQ